jgi:hypothetical protein
MVLGTATSRILSPNLRIDTSTPSFIHMLFVFFWGGVELPYIYMFGGIMSSLIYTCTHKRERERTPCTKVEKDVPRDSFSRMGALATKTIRERDQLKGQGERLVQRSKRGIRSKGERLVQRSKRGISLRSKGERLVQRSKRGISSRSKGERLVQGSKRGIGSRSKGERLVQGSKREISSRARLV